MFDLSMAEIGVIGVIALLVLGPERLPKAARTVGFYVRKARQSWYSVRSEFERELAAEELKRSLKLDEVHATLQDTANELRGDLASAGDALSAARREADEALSRTSGADPLPAALEAPVAAANVEADIDFGGLSPEELARQSETLPEQVNHEDEEIPHESPRESAAEFELPERLAGDAPEHVGVAKERAVPRPDGPAANT